MQGVAAEESLASGFDRTPGNVLGKPRCSRRPPHEAGAHTVCEPAR